MFSSLNVGWTQTLHGSLKSTLLHSQRGRGSASVYSKHSSKNPWLPVRSTEQTVDTKSYSLAYCELYVTLGTLFRRFDNLKVYNTGPEDLVYDDYFSTYHPVDARKFHVVGDVSSED